MSCYKPLREVEQRVNSTTPEALSIWLKERQSRSLDELAKLAEDYTLARKDKVTFSLRKPWVSTGVQEARTHRTGEGRTAPKREDPHTETRTRVVINNVYTVDSGAI